MAVKVNEINQVTQIPDAQKVVSGDGSFKFTLASAITDADLQAKVDELMNDITADRKSTRLNSSHYQQSRMPSSA